MAYRLFLDEDVDVHLAPLLRQAGHDVLTTNQAGRAQRQYTDDEQLEFATLSDRAIFTHNIRDFYPLAKEWGQENRLHSGIIVCERRPIRELARRFALLVGKYPDHHDIKNVYHHLPPLEDASGGDR